ncbi:MAG: hypothetical protein ACPG8W_23065 [Candidatus Promineifilaceae bacterium]
MHTLNRFLFLLILMTGLFAACSDAVATPVLPTEEPLVLEVSAEASSTPLPTATPEPTHTPSPIPTDEPTATPPPTATDVPTATPSPTQTPLPTATATATPLPTNTPVPPPTNTPIPLPTNTPIPPTAVPVVPTAVPVVPTAPPENSNIPGPIVAAANACGYTPEQLWDALGRRFPPNLPKAAEALGTTVDKLRECLPGRP